MLLSFLWRVGNGSRQATDEKTGLIKWCALPNCIHSKVLWHSVAAALNSFCQPATTLDIVYGKQHRSTLYSTWAYRLIVTFPSKPELSMRAFWQSSVKLKQIVGLGLLITLSSAMSDFIMFIFRRKLVIFICPALVIPGSPRISEGQVQQWSRPQHSPKSF